MKKPSIHHFDATGRSRLSGDFLEREVDRITAENERLKRVVLLQQRRWEQAHGPSPSTKPVFH